MLPIRTSISPRNTPYANYLLIAANIFIFLLTYWPHEVFMEGRRALEPLRPAALQFMLSPDRPYIWQFVTYAFLHGGWMHIIGNMYFLFMFGNNVNDRLGNVGYLCFYFAGAVFSGIGHSLLHTSPVLGASGAVAAVTGAYLVLFPNTLITVFFMFFYFWDTFEIRALYFIAFKLIFWDNIFEPKFSSQAIAYDAHLAGYFFGMLAILALLGVRLIDSGGVDMWSMIRQWNRRRTFKDAVSDGYDPFNPRLRKSINAEVKSTADSEQDTETNYYREQINSSIAYKNIAQAAEMYEELLEMDPKQTLGRQQQLDVANQLMSAGRWNPAAQAYENFITNYPGYEYIEQVQLMLGLLYTRYIHKADRAKELLQTAQQKLSQPDQIRMCKDLLAELHR